MAVLEAMAIISAIAAAGSAASSIHQGNVQSEALRNEEGRANQRAKDQQEALKKQQADAAAKEQSLATRDAQAAKMRVLRMGSQGRAGTILTGPQGTGAAPGVAAGGGGKTLLGS